ncbi:hypothetical protein ACQ4PT_000089 [Festuca glaucescens]
MGNDVATTRHVGEETIRITVMKITGKVLALDVRSTDTMGHVKTMIRGKLRVPPFRQRIVFDGKVLGPADDGRTLADCGVGKEAFLHLAIRRGRPVWVEVFVKVRTQRLQLATVFARSVVSCFFLLSRIFFVWYFRQSCRISW